MLYPKLTTKKIIIITIIICVAIGGFFWYLAEKEQQEIERLKEIRETFEKDGYIDDGQYSPSADEEYPSLPLNEEPDEELEPSSAEASEGEEEPEPSSAEASEDEELPLYPNPPWIGEYPFKVSSGKEGGYPKLGSGIFSKRPMDFIVGVDKQISTSIEVEDPDGVSKVTLVVIGYKDDLKKEIELKISDGDSFSGTWSATLAIPESFKRIFWTNFYTEGKSGETEELHLDWRPGATCSFGKGHLTNFGLGGCNIASDEVCGSETGELIVTGDVNLTGTDSHPAYLVFGTKVTITTGRVIFSPHAGGKPTAIMIKAGRTDSFFNWVAHIYVKDTDNDGYWDINQTAGKYGAGTCVNQSAAEDLYDDCTTAAAGQAGSCQGNLCDGAGACTYLTAGEQSQLVCKRCSGSSYNPVNVTNDTQDSEGTNTCTATCKKCSGGECVNQTSLEDLFTHCTPATPPNPGSCAGDLCDGYGACQAYTAEGEGGQPVCKRCSGTSVDPVNVTINTQDDEGTNKCIAECKKCSGGECVNQSAAEDLFSQCPDGTCRTGDCNNAGACGFPSDDSVCGTISCSSWYVQTGTEGAASTEYCYNKADIITNRCEALADCKDANTADCDAQANSAEQYSCATCAYISAASCTGTTLGSCTNYNSSTQGPTADSYYDNGADSPTGTNYCVLRDYHCTGTSAAETYTDSTVATCDACKYCNGSSCANYANDTSCGGSCYYCDNGSCVSCWWDYLGNSPFYGNIYAYGTAPSCNPTNKGSQMYWSLESYSQQDQSCGTQWYASWNNSGGWGQVTIHECKCQ